MGAQRVWADASILLSQKKRLRVGSILTQILGHSAGEGTEPAAEVLACESLSGPEMQDRDCT